MSIAIAAQLRKKLPEFKKRKDEGNSHQAYSLFPSGTENPMDNGADMPTTWRER
jgi:hypothetical protein